MAMSVEVGTFVANTGGTTTTVPTGFQGKAVILISHGKADETESAGATMAWGFFDGTNKVGKSWSGVDAVTTTDTTKSFDNTLGLRILATSGAPLQNVSSVAFNATPNMVLTWNSTPTVAWKITYILLGGSDITNVFVGNDTIPTTAIPKSFTGFGFKPDAVLVISHGATPTSTGTQGTSSLGFVTDSPGSIKQWAWGGTTQDNQTTDAAVNAVSRLDNDKTHIRISPTSGVLITSADCTNLDSDGFTLNFTAVSGTADRVGYIGFKGGYWDCGTQAKPSTATTQSVTGLAFIPKLLGYLLSSATSLATVTSDEIETFGAGTSPSARGYAGNYHKDVVTTNTVTRSAGSSALISHEMNATANMDFTSFESVGGWTGTWSASGTAFQSAWFAVGDTLVVPGGLKGGYLLRTGL